MIEQIIGYQARLNPRAVAILTPYAAITFRELENEVDRTAVALLGEAAFGPARRIGVAIADPIRHWLATLALLRLGRLSISLPKQGQANARAAAQVAKADLVLRDEPSSDTDGPVVIIDDAWMHARPKSIPATFVPAQIPPTQLMRVILSSGTTGAPKPVSYSTSTMVTLPKLSTTGVGGRRGLTTMGPQTAGGFTFPFMCWARGGAVIFPEANFDWGSVLTTLQPDYMMLAPADLQQLLRSLPADFTPSEVITIHLGGSTLPQSVSAEARRRLAARLIMMYGSTEAGLVSRMTPSDQPAPPGAVGYIDPRGVEVEILDPDGRPLPRGRSGEIRIRSPELKRYEDGDDRDVFRDGWFHPGDVGRIMPDGMLVIEGRTSEFINLGGAKYAPFVIEEVLRACPGVRDVAAFALTTPEGITSAHAALVLDDAFEIDAANAALRSHFPKLALHVMTVQAIPRNAMGKAEHQTLRRMAAAQKAN